MTSVTTLDPPADADTPARADASSARAEPPPAGLTRMAIDCRLDYELDGDCDFVFMILPSLADQTVHHEVLTLTPEIPHHLREDASSGNRLLRLRAPAGSLGVAYRASWSCRLMARR